MTNQLQHITEWEPAYDKRDSDPSKNYGIHGMVLRFLVKGSNGVVQFIIYTNWHLSNVQKELDNEKYSKDSLDHIGCHPMGADIGYHSYTPLYEGQDILPYPCKYLGNVSCYYDGSGFQAEKLLKQFITVGDDVVWQTLEKKYMELPKRNI